MSESLQIDNGQTPAEKSGQWFVIHTLSGHENKVRDKIMHQIQSDENTLVYDAVIPTEKVVEIRQGKKTTTTRKLFPGYIWVRMDLYDENGLIRENAWYAVRGIQGVLGFLGGENRPSALTDREVEDILRSDQPGEEEVKPKIAFELGEMVRIKDGAFENFEGAIQEIDSERGKLRLMVSIFGRSTPVELEFWQVERTV